MSVPFHKRLAFAFSRAFGKGKGDIYSRVIEVETKAAIYGEFSNSIAYYAPKTTTFWFKAEPIKGAKDKYVLQQYQYSLTHAVAISHKRQRDSFTLDGVYSRAQALKALQKLEADVLSMNKHAYYPAKQSFKARGAERFAV